MKSNNTFFGLITIGVLFVAIVFGASLLGVFKGYEPYQQFIAAMLSVAATGAITALLLIFQRKQQEELNEKQREFQEQANKDQREYEKRRLLETKVFEEKLCIYKDFLHCLYEVIKDGEVTEEEAIRLQFQTSFITMHTDSKHIKTISKKVQSIVSDLKNKEGDPNKAKNEAENNAKNNKNLMSCLFSIVEEFKKELYQSELNQKDQDNINEAIQAFGSIMDAVEVKEEVSNMEIISIADANVLSQKLSYFENELKKRIESKFNNWTVYPKSGELNKGVYINIAYKGKEEDIRIILSYDESGKYNGEHYFQVHLEHDNSPEVYKHMKWCFGGRQNKWSWWRYLDKNYRMLANIEDLLSRDWDKSLTYCETKLTELLTYVETFVKVRDEIYYEVPRDKANVWLYYNKCVAFDFDKSLPDRLFFDVVLEDDNYYIEVGNRDNDVPKLLERLEQMGFNKKEQDLENKRYRVYEKLTAEEAVERVKELSSNL